MDKKALKKHILYLESRNDDNLSKYSNKAKKDIKQNNKKTAKSLRKLFTKL